FRLEHPPHDDQPARSIHAPARPRPIFGPPTIHVVVTGRRMRAHTPSRPRHRPAWIPPVHLPDRTHPDPPPNPPPPPPPPPRPPPPPPRARRRPPLAPGPEPPPPGGAAHPL